MQTILTIMRSANARLAKEDILQQAEQKEVPREKAIRCLQILFRHGEIFEPAEGYIQRV